ncbi:MAG: helix-turn-helix domain-containing protein [Actinomycetota bacterium]
MRLRSEQGPVLAGVEASGVDRISTGTDARGAGETDRLDRLHHQLLWSPTSAMQIATARQSILVGSPFGLWLPAGHPHDITASSPWWTARFVASSCPVSWNRLTQIPLDEVVGPMLIHLHRLPSDARADTVLALIVDHVRQSFVANQIPLRFPTDPRARQVVDDLVADPGCRMELADWAPSVGASERTLRRLFTEQTGVPFRRWRVRLRAQTATRLLRDRVPVADVARHCGYGSPEALARAVRGEFGMSPTELAGLRADRSCSFDEWPLASEACPPRSGLDGDALLQQLTPLIAGDHMLRPSVRPALLMSAALLLAAACGSDDPADSSSSSDAGSASVTAESDDQASGGDSADTTVAGTSEEEETDMTDADTVTETETETVDDEDAVETQVFVDDLGREVEIPADPQRVIFVGVEHAAHVTTLGFEPLAVASSYLGDAGAELEAIGGVPVDLGGMVDVGDGEPNFEAIAAAEPDLLVWWTDEDVVATLSEIAPTIAIDARANGTNFIDDNDGPRWSKQRSLAELFGLEERLDEQIVEYEDLVADIRARHGGLTESLEWALFDTWEGQAYMYNTPTYAYNAALPDIGLTPTASHERATAEGVGYDESIGYAVIAAELVPDYDADLIFVSRPEPDAAIDTVLEATAAGASDQVYPVDVARWTFHVLQAEISVLREVDAILSAGDVEDLGDFG